MTHENRKTKLAFNIICNTLAVVITNAALFVGNWAIIRYYGSNFHGDFAWLFSVVSVLCLVSELGLAGNAGVRTIARLRAKQPDRLNDTISMMFFVPMVVAGVLVVGLILLRTPICLARPSLTPVFVMLTGFWLIFMVFARICRAIAIGYENLSDTLYMQSVADAIRVTVVLVCCFGGFSALWLFGGWTISLGAAVLMCIWRVSVLAKRFGFKPTKPNWNLGQIVSTVAKAFPYYIPMLGMMGLPFAAQLLTSAFVKGSAQQVSTAISIVQVCCSFALIARMFAIPVATSLLPRLAHLDASRLETHSMHTVINQSSRFLGMISVTVLTGFWIFGQPILGLLYPKQLQYSDSISTLLWFVPAIAADSYSMILDQILMAGKHVKIVAIFEVIKYLLMTVLAWILGSIWGTMGISIAITIAVVLPAIIKIFPAKRQFTQVGVYPFVATMICCGILGGVGYFNNNPIILIPVFIISVLATRLIIPRELIQWMRIGYSTITKQK